MGAGGWRLGSSQWGRWRPGSAGLAPRPWRTDHRDVGSDPAGTPGLPLCVAESTAAEGTRRKGTRERETDSSRAKVLALSRTEPLPALSGWELGSSPLQLVSAKLHGDLREGSAPAPRSRSPSKDSGSEALELQFKKKFLVFFQ